VHDEIGGGVEDPAEVGLATSLTGGLGCVCVNHVQLVNVIHALRKKKI